ncbi:MAG: cysteine desulfurase [Candidatus Gracilibacteria bacterium]
MNIQELKKDFPILQQKIKGKTLVYLDNASTSQKPLVVIKALEEFYLTSNANIHRGIHTLSERATEAYEKTRTHVAKFINASESAEIIFTRNATESINLVAYTWCEQNIYSGDDIVVSALEHHSNLVPWQQVCLKKKANLKVIPINKDGTLDLSNLESLITEKTKLVAVTQMSNALGTVVPLEKIIARARMVGAKILVDGAQGIPHLGIDVRKLDIDFLAFSAHKMLGPTGVGILYGKRELLENMPPFLFGGEMILEVDQFESRWNQIPWKFEAGTPNIADVVAFDAALSYIEKIGYDFIKEQDQKLLAYARAKLSTLPGIEIYGPADQENEDEKSLSETSSTSDKNAHSARSSGILSFNIPGVHPHDVGSILSEEGVAIRAGHHCAQPLLASLGIFATARMSFYFYNTEEDIDAAFDALKKVYKLFKI